MELEIDSVRADIVRRRADGPVRFQMTVSFEQASVNGESVVVPFRVVRDTGFVRGILLGRVYLYPDRESLESVLREVNSEKKPPGLFNLVFLKSQAIFLLLEDYMGVPPIPVLPVVGGESRRSDVSLYQ